MKKLKYILIIFITLFMCNMHVHAASASLSASSTNVYVGDTFTIYVNMHQAAAWSIHVSSSGPVSGCSINQADATSDAMDTSKTFSATCTATSEGNISIKLSGDITSSSDGNPVNISGNLNVISSKKPTQNTNNNGNNNNSNSNSNNSNNNANSNNNTGSNNSTKNQETKSNNNNIKELFIDNYVLNKIDSNNYTLTVSNDVTTINVSAKAEDSKSQITGLGKKELSIGENNIEIVITSESGLQNKINIKIIRKDGYYIEDLEDLLNNKNLKNINVIVTKDEKISSEILKKIKESKKVVNLNYFSDDKKLMYSWIIDGSKITSINNLQTIVNFDSSNKKEISKLSNYADGLYISFSKDGKIPSGTKLKIYIGDKFTNGDKINIYEYIKDELNLVKEGISVKDGYITFDINQKDDHFITMSKIINVDEVTSSSDSMNFILIIIIILTIILLSITIIIFIIKRKNSSFEYKNSIENQNNGEANNIFINNK